jgi:hypothetical protein
MDEFEVYDSRLRRASLRGVVGGVGIVLLITAGVLDQITATTYFMFFVLVQRF